MGKKHSGGAQFDKRPKLTDVMHVHPHIKLGTYSACCHCTPFSNAGIATLRLITSRFHAEQRQPLMPLHTLFTPKMAERQHVESDTQQVLPQGSMCVCSGTPRELNVQWDVQIHDVWKHICMYTRTYARMQARMYVCMCVCAPMYVCMYVCMYQ